MSGLKMSVIGVGLLAMISGGCQNKVKQENDELWQQNRELQERNTQLEAQLRQAPDARTYAQLQSENQRLASEVAQLQENLRQQPAGAPTPGLEGIDAVYDAAAGTAPLRAMSSTHASTELPGTGETPAAPVFVDGEKVATLRGADVANQFKVMVADYIERKFGSGQKAAAE